ncbi:hypothetical protein E3N88_28741 [Mikania micrantha]|uniref:Uncharacterized protein n=1 Tax=Mikania micrantha TaxID=192012 RepID=A0A5N6N1J0_9ASTR|nr:hypothetical protein E3N88_28741 [Mikania micrantha]
MASNGFLKVEEGCSRAPGSVMGCQAYRLTLVGMMCRYARIRYRRGAQIPPARIACRGLPGSGVPPGLNFKPNKLVFIVLAQSCPFLDCRTSFERRLDPIGQLLAIIDL